MLAALLLAGMVAAPLGSAWLFVPAKRHARTTGAWPAIRRLLFAVAATTALAATVAGALRLLGVSQHNLVAAIAGVVFASLAWFPATRRWNARAHLCWASSVFLFVVYLTFALEWTFTSHLGPASTAGGVLLWFFEVFAAVLSCAYLWEICDALGTEHWRRRVTPQVSFAARDGTMGLIRRVALDELGGWDEWCITEDAELSLRLLRAGWSGLHVDQSWGFGIMPLTFEALKGQRYRWCFGGIQILRMHWRSLLPGRKTRQNHLSTAQRWAYLAGGIQWYGDLLGLVFLVFLLAGAANLATGGGELFRKLTAFLLATVPVLVVLGLVRAVALLRRGTGASWRDAIGAFFIWQSTSLVVARASVLGLFARKAAFLRTPKTSERAKWWEALRANWAESALALLGAAGITGALSRATQLSGPLLAALLLFPTLGMAAAPFNSWAARRAALPAWLRERRRTEYRRDRRAFAAGFATGGLVAVAGVVTAAVVLMLTPSHHPVQSPSLVAPAHSTSAPARPSPSPSRSSPPAAPSTTPPATSAPPAASPSESPTPSVSPTPTATPTVTPSAPPAASPPAAPTG